MEGKIDRSSGLWKPALIDQSKYFTDFTLWGKIPAGRQSGKLLVYINWKLELTNEKLVILFHIILSGEFRLLRRLF